MELKTTAMKKIKNWWRERRPIPNSIQETCVEFEELKGRKEINDGRGALLKYSIDSFEIKRSHKKCIILMSGESGVGKSTLVNHVFGIELCKTSDSKSETRSATEFSMIHDISRLYVSELPVSFVDTPGMCDTDGLDQDARNVFAIQQYVRTALEKDQFPNVVLLLIKANDNRFEGRNSKLSKTIRSLKALNVIDAKNPNLVVVLTYIMGIGKKQWDMKRAAIQCCIEAICNFVPPVVFVENDVTDFDLPMNEKTGCSRLPNGDVQPHNVTEAILNLFAETGDKLGEVALKATYEKGDTKHKIKETMNVDATDSKTPMSYDERHIRSLLNDAGEETEIELHVKKWLKENEVDKMLSVQLNQVCESLVGDCEIETIDNLRNFSLQQVVYMTRKITDQIAVESYEAFADVFQLDKIYRVPDSCKEVGKGFDLLAGDFSASSIFEIDSNDDKFLDMLKSFVPRTFFDGGTFNEASDYVKIYLYNLGQKLNTDSAKFLKTGSKIRPMSLADSRVQPFAFFEYEIRLLNPHLPEEHQFRSGFLNAVEQLPEEYIFDDESCADHYNNFCQNWGSHYIKSGYCGGSIQMGGYMMKEDHDTKRSLEADMFQLSQHWESRFSSAFDKKKLEFFGFDVSVSGGTEQVLKEFPKKLVCVNSETIAQWKVDVLFEPAFLKSGLHLAPMDDLIRANGYNKKAKAFSDAMVVRHLNAEAVEQLKEKREQEREELRREEEEEKRRIQRKRELLEKRLREEEAERLEEERRKAEREEKRRQMEEEEREKVERLQREEDERRNTKRKERERRRREEDEQERREEEIRLAEKKRNKEKRRQQELEKEFRREREELRENEELERRKKQFQDMNKTRAEAAATREDPSFTEKIGESVTSAVSSAWAWFKSWF